MRDTWACKNFGLVAQMKKVKQLMGNFKAIELHRVARNKNQEADALASKQLAEFGVHAISVLKPKFDGNQHLQDVIKFLETRECLAKMTKSKKDC